MTIKGDAGFKYTPPGGSEVTHALQFPLTLELAPGHNTARFAVDSLDKSVREVISVGDGRAELAGTLRFESDPQGLLDMLEEGANGTVLTYYPSLAETSISFDLWLVYVGDVVQLQTDRQRMGFGEYEVRVRFRDASGSGVSLSDLFTAA